MLEGSCVTLGVWQRDFRHDNESKIHKKIYTIRKDKLENERKYLQT